MDNKIELSNDQLEQVSGGTYLKGWDLIQSSLNELEPMVREIQGVSKPYMDLLILFLNRSAGIGSAAGNLRSAIQASDLSDTEKGLASQKCDTIISEAKGLGVY